MKYNNLLKELIGCSILGIKLDNQKIELESKVDTWFGEEVKIIFSNKKELIILTEDIPHFYGEGDINLLFRDIDYKYINQLGNDEKTRRITNIKMYKWKSKSIFFFKPPIYFVQLEFFSKEDLLLSVGFFYFDKTTKKTECLITGELSVSFFNSLKTTKFYKDKILVEKINT